MTISVAEPAPGRGVVVAEIDLSFVREVIARARVGTTGYAYAVDSRGVLITHPIINLVLQHTSFALLPQVRAGRLNALAVTAMKRSAMAADVPSVAELGYPQLESLAWIGLLAPTGTASSIVSRLSAETVRAMRSADTQDSLGKQGFDVVASSPVEFAAWIRAESAKWSKVIRASGATAD